MDDKTYRAMVVREAPEGGFSRSIEECRVADLPAGDLLIRVQYSSLNYKDALSASGNRGVTMKYPHTPGIDAAGVVEACETGAFDVGQKVVVIGRDLGSNTWGGYGRYVRVPSEWAVPLPEGMSLKESMLYGTAGYTAADSVLAVMDHGVTPEMGEVLVTGASGGVGSLAVAFLAKSGFKVVAASGKPQAVEMLKGLGASEVIPREEVLVSPKKPLARTRWAGVVDTVGGEYLDSAIRSTVLHGAASCCGMIASADLKTSIFPFILRGVALFGIDSAWSPPARRERIWGKLASDWRLGTSEGDVSACAGNSSIGNSIAGNSSAGGAGAGGSRGCGDVSRVVTDCTLEELDDKIELILKGGVMGRVRVCVSG